MKNTERYAANEYVCDPIQEGIPPRSPNNQQFAGSYFITHVHVCKKNPVILQGYINVR